MGCALAHSSENVVRIRLPVVLRHMLAGRTFEEAVRMVGFDGSGIAHDDTTRLLNSADYLLCDGLDECDPQRMQIAEHILRWSLGHGNCRICVATRPVGHESALLPGFTHFALLPPENHQIHELSRKLFAKSIGNNSYVVKLQRFLERIDSKSDERHIYKLASRNPLLLGFLIRLSIDDVDVGKTRSDLYSHIFEIVARTAPNDRETIDVNTRIATETINALAWKQTQTPFCSTEEALRFISDHLRACFGLEVLAADEAAKLAIRFWENRRLLETVTSGNDSRTFFVHLSLQEFAAARYARSLNHSDFRDWIRQVRRKAAWKQVILLLSGIDNDARTMVALLDLDDPTDAVSRESLLATDALFEREPLDLAVLPRLLKSLETRFQSEIPLVSIEAAENLTRLGPFSRKQVLQIAQSETTKSPWANFGGLALRLASDDEHKTLDEFKEWFKGFEPVRVHIPKLISRDESQLIPEEGRELQQTIITLGIERIFATHNVKDIEAFFAGLGELRGLSINQISAMEKRLRGIGLDSTADRLCRSGFDVSALSGIEAGIRRWRKGEAKLLELIGLAADKSTVLDSAPPFFVLSALIAGLGYWESTAGTLATFEDIEPSQDLIGMEVICALAATLKLNLVELGAEANAALEFCKLHEKAMYNVLEHVNAEPDWSELARTGLDSNLVAQGILHPCPLIGVSAANAILSGFGVADAAKVIPDALESRSEDVIRFAVAIANKCLGETDIDLFLSRLERPIYVGHKWLFAGMAQHCRVNQRRSVVDCFFSWITVDDPELATGIAESLSEFDPPLGVEVIDRVRRTLAHWTERGSKCEKHGIVVKGGSCPECSIVPPSPRGAIFKELIRLNDVDFDELVDSCRDPRHDVSDLAKSTLIERAAIDPEVLSKVIDLVEVDRLSPNLLEKLLKLPIEKDSAAAKKAEALLDSGDLRVRLATMGQLTGEWIDRTRAVEYLRSRLSDREPAVRTLATRILRLLD